MTREQAKAIAEAIDARIVDRIYCAFANRDTEASCGVSLDYDGLDKIAEAIAAAFPDTTRG